MSGRADAGAPWLDARGRLLRLLDRHRPADGMEAADVTRIREMVLTTPNIASSDCTPGHITASALVLDMASGRLLFHLHKRLARWLQVGGRMEEGEIDPADTALREASEETGLPDLAFLPAVSELRPLDIDVHQIPARGLEPEHLHLDFRYVLATNHPDRVQAGGDESGLFRWMSFDDVAADATRFDRALLRLVGKARRLYGEETGETA